MWRAGGERTAFCVSLISSKIQRLLFAIKWKTEMQGQARNDRSLVVRRRAAIRPILVSFRCAQMMTRCPDRLPNLPSEQLAITLAIRSTKPTIRERARQGNSCAAAPFVPRPSFSNSTPLLKTHHPRYVLLTSVDSSLHFCLSVAIEERPSVPAAGSLAAAMSRLLCSSQALGVSAVLVGLLKQRRFHSTLQTHLRGSRAWAGHRMQQGTGLVMAPVVSPLA